MRTEEQKEQFTLALKELDQVLEIIEKVKNRIEANLTDEDQALCWERGIDSGLEALDDLADAYYSAWADIEVFRDEAYDDPNPEDEDEDE